MNKDIEKITYKFKNTQEFNNKLSEYLNESLTFGGKTASQWKEYFKVDIPDEINPMIIVQLNAELFRKYQEASVFRDQQNMQLTVLEQSKSDRYNAAYNKTRTDHESRFGKGLAAKSCEIAAELAIKDLVDAISNQKAAKDFWKSTCDTLTELRKLLEQMGYALSADARINSDFKIYQNKINNEDFR